MNNRGHHKPELDIVIPVYNEAESLETLHRELIEVAADWAYALSTAALIRQ